MFAITGITGNVGGEVARNLLAAGRPVRAVVRDLRKGEAWAKLGCDLMGADSIWRGLPSANTRLAEAIEHFDRSAARVLLGLDHEWGNGGDKHGLSYAPLGLAVLRNIACHLAAARGMSDVDRILLVEMLGHSRCVGRVMVHVVASAHLRGATVTTPVMRDNAIAVGKEKSICVFIASAIHSCSKRRDRAFIKLNCTAIPVGLLESELFGHEKGAFTGAIARKIGRFEAAHGGTLFLDEIGDIPLELQPKLLRVLQEGEFERLGSTQTQRVNVRLVAATNGDMGRLISEKRFRSDLYYRLNVFPISVPPLRDRAEDIPLLVTHFVAKYAARMQKVIERIRAEVMDALTFYSWPGNIRELQNFIE